jgi:replicative DNA helicase
MQTALAPFTSPTTALAAPLTPPGETPYRTPPHNLEAEQALLGALLVNNQAFEKVSEFLLADHFAESVHGRIFTAIGRLVERGQVANPVTLKGYVEQDADLRAAGGANYLADLAAAVISVVNAGDYGRIVYDLYLRRQLIALGEDVVNGAYSLSLDASAIDQIEITEKKLFDLASTGQQEKSFQTFGQAVSTAVAMAEAAWRRQGGLAGVASGLNDLDRLLGGLHPSDLLILAGRPSMGKTSLATNMAFYAAEHLKWENDAVTGRRKAVEGAVVAFFSLEMSAEQLAGRILSEQANVPSEKIRRGDMTHEEFDRLVEASQRLAALPLFIDDTPAISVTALRTRARRLKRQYGLGMIVVDYLQLMRANIGQKVEGRVQEISEITRGLKAIAKELNVPVIALSQLSRAVESRDDKRPQLSDLRESGSIEQDADVVMFVYREEYYLSRAEPSRKPEESDEKFNQRYDEWRIRLEEAANIAEVIIAKQRHGPIGKVRAHFDGATTKFSNLMTSGGAQYGLEE